MAVKSKNTRFRAYQLGNAGSSFSYFDGKNFTLIEARYNDVNKVNIKKEMKICKVYEVSTLHITSWDQDHCSASELEEIISELKPKKIEYPGYKPHTDSGNSCLEKIENLERKKKGINAVPITPKYISSLNKANLYGYNDILYHPKWISEESSNDNSTIKLFRSGSFNVLSLGDVESTQISSGLTRTCSIKNEIDIMILAHHGANNGFTTSRFLQTVKPKIAIASADYANQFKHPKQEIRNLLHTKKIQLFTTKTGDVVIFSIGDHTGKYKLENFKSNSSDLSSTTTYSSKKMKYLKVNNDTMRDRSNRSNRGP